MRKHLPLLLLPVLALACTSTPKADAPAPAHSPADALARRVANAAGARAWPDVARLRFTFNVVDDGKTVLSAGHDWDLVTGTDTVTWSDKGTAKTVTVSTAGKPPADAPDDQKKAFARWTNDSYWLLMPVKLFDPGVTRTLLPPTVIDGTAYETLELSFGPVGLTSGDKYRLYIQGDHVRLWDYIPAPDKSVRFTWTDYRKVPVGRSNLTLAHDHATADGKRHITFTDVSATSK